MEIVDNGFVLLVPGAMEAGLGDFLFWWSLGVGLFHRLLGSLSGQPRIDRQRPRPRGRARPSLGRSCA
jgi:hypothetical protein